MFVHCFNLSLISNLIYSLKVMFALVKGSGSFHVLFSTNTVNEKLFLQLLIQTLFTQHQNNLNKVKYMTHTQCWSDTRSSYVARSFYLTQNKCVLAVDVTVYR